jgi:hypothetical protein
MVDTLESLGFQPPMGGAWPLILSDVLVLEYYEVDGLVILVDIDADESIPLPRRYTTPLELEQLVTALKCK